MGDLHLKNNPYYDVTVKTLVEYESDLPKDIKNEIINAKVAVADETDSTNFSKTEHFNISYKENGERISTELSLDYGKENEDKELEIQVRELD